LDFFDHEAQQVLALFEVQVVERGDDSLGEGGDATAELVVLGEGLMLFDEAAALGFEGVASLVDFTGASAKLGQVDEVGLVAVDETAVLGLDRFGLAVETAELLGDDLIVGHGCSGSHRVFAGRQHFGSHERVANLVEDEGVEGVGSDVALRAAAVLAAGSEGIVVAAVVVTVPVGVGLLRRRPLVAGHRDAAVSAADQAAQQERPGLGSSGTEVGVASSDLGGGFEDGVIEYGGHGDGDPLLFGSGPLT
jgi:hypothetical protein